MRCHFNLHSYLLCLEFWSFSSSDFMKGDLGSWNLSGQKSLNGFLTFKEAQALILQQCQTTLGPQSSLGHYLCVYTWDELVKTWILSLKKKFDLQNAFVVTEKKMQFMIWNHCNSGAFRDSPAESWWARDISLIASDIPLLILIVSTCKIVKSCWTSGRDY